MGINKMRILLCGFLSVLAMSGAWARVGPWSTEKAWAWSRAQPWLRGCNYLPASAVNPVEQWQAQGSEARFAEVEKELALAEKIGFNTLRLIFEQQGFAVWLQDHDGFMVRLERMLTLMEKHHLRAIILLGNDCSRPKELWKMPQLGEQSYDVGYHGGRRVTEHGSNPKAMGYTVVDDPVLRPKFYQMCEELLTKYRTDTRILLWELWNEPGNNNRGERTMKDMRELFELAWKIDPIQPLGADIWRTDLLDHLPAVQKLAGDLSDVTTYHCYAPFGYQRSTIHKLKARWNRPLICTEWLARITGDEVQTSYPVFAQEGVGCMCWGFVAGKYQGFEPYEPWWKTQFEFKSQDLPVTKWFHDLFRPSHHPYDPEEIAVIMRVNKQMDSEKKGDSIRLRIQKACGELTQDMWYGYRRMRFQFHGREAWVVEPSVAPREGMPWTWTLQWRDAFVDRTSVLDLLKRGFHHVSLELFDTRMDEKGVQEAQAFQQFLVSELGFEKQANLVGMSWGGFFSVRYAAAHPTHVKKIYLDAPLLSFQDFSWGNSTNAIGSWALSIPTNKNWQTDLRMPVNKAALLAQAKIPLFVLYGGQDQVVKPSLNIEPFLKAFKEAGGVADVHKRGLFGHHPHGLDPNKIKPLVKFFTNQK